MSLELNISLDGYFSYLISYLPEDMQKLIELYKEIKNIPLDHILDVDDISDDETDEMCIHLTREYCDGFESSDSSMSIELSNPIFLRYEISWNRKGESDKIVRYGYTIEGITKNDRQTLCEFENDMGKILEYIFTYMKNAISQSSQVYMDIIDNLEYYTKWKM